ncbi:MAG: CheR family methyltransferase [Nibricoccus sp.]
MVHTHLFFQGTAKQVRREIPPVAEHWPAAKAGPVADAGQLLPLIFSLTQLSLDRYRLPAFQRRVPACLRRLRVATEQEACRKIFERPAQAYELLDVVLLGVSGFFRDASVFDALEHSVLPRLLKGAGRIRIWSSACSAGQELYSVAMLLDDLGGLGRAELVGTDCRGSAITRAAAGVYLRTEAECLANRGHQARASKTSVEINPFLRDCITWRKTDLLAGAEPGPWHLILWRNMAIYLDAPIAAKLWHALFQQLAPGGYIVGGKADFPPADLPLIRRSRCIYQKPPL